MAIDGVVGGMQGADAPLLAGSVEGIRRGPAPDHTVEDDPGAGFGEHRDEVHGPRTLTKVTEQLDVARRRACRLDARAQGVGGGEITTSGSSTFVRSLLNLKLLNEVNLLVHRVIVGRGKRLAEGNVDQLPLELIRSTAFDNGVSHQLYRPAS